MATQCYRFLEPARSSASFCGGRAALALALCFAAVAVAAMDNADEFTAVVADIVREPVRFAAGALAAPPPGALTAAPGAWPALVPNCTAAYLNASVAAAGPSATTVVRVEVPAGRAVSLRECRSSIRGEAAPMWHVRLVLAMGRSSAVALEAWDVAVGGVTIEGPVGNASSVVDALVVVHGGSRVVAGTASRAASSGMEEDVHAMSVVAPASSGPGTAVSVSGLGLVVSEGSLVRAQHDGAGVLYASACAVRAGPAQHPGAASLTVERLRMVIAGGSSVAASTTHTGAAYDWSNARQAHVATMQALPGSRVSAAWVVVAVLDGSTASAFGDDGSSAAGGIGVNARERRRDTTTFLPSTVVLTHATLIAAGPNTTVCVTTKGQGLGTSAMGVAAYNSAEASMTDATVYVGGPNTTVAVNITGYGGFGATAMGVASYDKGAASMDDVALCVVGSNTTVAVHVGEGAGVSVLGAAADHDAVATMVNATVYVAGPHTTVALNVAGAGLAAAAVGVAAYWDGAKASMSNVALCAVGPDTSIEVVAAGRDGYGASAMGVAAYKNATASMTNAVLYVAGPTSTVAVRVAEGGRGASAMGVAAYHTAAASMTNATLYATGANTTVAVDVENGNGEAASAMGVAACNFANASMMSSTLYAVGPGTTIAIRVSGGVSYGASAMGIGLSGGGRFAASGNTTITRCPNVAVTAVGAADITVFNATPHPNVTFRAPSQCPPAPQLPSLRVPQWIVLPGVSGDDGGGRTVTAPSERKVVVNTSMSRSPWTNATTRAPADGVSMSASQPNRSLRASVTVTPRLATPASDVISATASATRTAHPPDDGAIAAATAAPVPVVAPSPVPAAVSASVSVLAGVLLPSSASKPMGNARALRVADVCLSAVGGGEALEAAEPGDWPSDYAVIVARWRVGSGGNGNEGSAARARAAGAAVAVACVAVASVAAVVRFAAPPPPSNVALTSSARGNSTAADTNGGDATSRSAAAASPASVCAVAFAVAVAYLVPNALEAAVVAVTAGLGGTTGAAGVAAGCVMVAAVVPIFAIPVGTAGGATQLPLPAASAVPPAGALRRVAGFLHPVLVDGLRDEASPPLRAHALLDIAAACIIAAASGATQGGVRVGGSCVLLALVMAAAAAGLTAYHALVRPFATRLEVAVATAQAGTLAVLCGLTLAAVASGGAAVSGEALGAAGLAAEAVALGAPVVLVAPVAMAWLHGEWRVKGRHHRVAAVGGPSASSAPLLTLPACPDGQSATMNVVAPEGHADDDDDAVRGLRLERRNPLARS